MTDALKQMASGVSFSTYWKLAMKAEENTKFGKFCNHIAVIIGFTLLQIAGPIFEIIAGMIKVNRGVLKSIPIMQFMTRILTNTQSKLSMFIDSVNIRIPK